jgi:glycosyltransferase involved in cell wall biosynthesis
MQDHPLVSIITIVYNGEKHLQQTIESVLAQSYKPIEYLVVDGGSTDNSLNIIKSFDSKITRWKSEKDRGISDAFNKGLAMARGEIIGIINADDWYEYDTVEKVVDSLIDADIVYGDLRLIKDGKTDFILKGNHQFLDSEMTINHPTVFVRKACYDQRGTFDEKYKCAMDYELMLRFKISGFRFKHVPFVLANMRWEGMSDSKWLLGCQETLDIKNTYFPQKKWANKLYFYKHVLAIWMSKFLTRLKLGIITRAYRSQISRVKKIYD